MEDLIRRQALYEILDDYDEGKIYWGEAEDRIGNLPSENPDLSGYSDKLWQSAYASGYERCRQDAMDALAKFVPYAIFDESTESYTNGLTDAYNLICQLPSAQTDKDMLHLQREQAYMQGWEDAYKSIRLANVPSPHKDQSGLHSSTVSRIYDRGWQDGQNALRGGIWEDD